MDNGNQHNKRTSKKQLICDIGKCEVKSYINSIPEKDLSGLVFSLNFGGFWMTQYLRIPIAMEFPSRRAQTFTCHQILYILFRVGYKNYEIPTLCYPCHSYCGPYGPHLVVHVQNIPCGIGLSTVSTVQRLGFHLILILPHDPQLIVITINLLL